MRCLNVVAHAPNLIAKRLVNLSFPDGEFFFSPTPQKRAIYLQLTGSIERDLSDACHVPWRKRDLSFARVLRSPPRQRPSALRLDESTSPPMHIGQAFLVLSSIYMCIFAVRHIYSYGVATMFIRLQYTVMVCLQYRYVPAGNAVNGAQRTFLTS